MARKQLIDRKHEVQAEYRRTRGELDRLRSAPQDRRTAGRITALEQQLGRLGTEEHRLRIQIDQTSDPTTGRVLPMPWFKKLMSILRGEAADVKEGFSNVGKSLDEELAKKERELDASPEERIDMILEENAAADERFAELEAKVHNEVAEPKSEAETDQAAEGLPDAE